MKTILTALLLACGLSALAAECDERPRLTTQYYPNYPDGIPLLLIGWGPTACTNWAVEVSQDLINWGSYTGYFGGIFKVCTNDAEPDRCLRHIIERTTEHRQQFYRLRLQPN